MNSPFPHQNPSARTASGRSTARGVIGQEKPTVSVVDDDPAIRAMVADELIDSGCFALSFSNCLALHEVLADRMVDLVFLDVQMQECNGIDCLRNLRARGFTVPVVIFTSLNEPELRRQALAAGASDYVLKHHFLERLPGLLERLLPTRPGNGLL